MDNTQVENEAATTDAPPKNGKQQHLPGDGMAPPNHPEIDAAAETYQEIKTNRVKLTKKETEAREVLAQVMEKHGLDVYRDESADLVVTAKKGDIKISVKPGKGETTDDSGDEE